MRWTAKQQEYIDNASARWNIKFGATRSGKTYLDYYLIPRRIRERAGQDGLIFIMGNTKGTLQRNVIEPMQNIWGVGLVGDIRSDNTCKMFGERVFCLGADNIKHVDRVRGAAVKYVYGDEVTTWHESVFQMLKSRLDKPYSLFDGTCNPEHPQHWLKQFIDSDANIYSQKYTLFDNDFLDENVKRDIELEHTGVWYDRNVMGDWVVAEGLIYANFNSDVHVVQTEARKYEKYVVSMDYGIKNPTAMLLWGLCDGIWYCTAEYYHDGRNSQRQKTDDDYYQELCKLVGDLKIDKVIVDPSAASFITLIRNKGQFSVRGANNSVLDGIAEVSTALQRGVIRFNKACKETIKEFGLYRWNEKYQDDAPLKEHDHAMDAVRYFVYTQRILKGARVSLLD